MWSETFTRWIDALFLLLTVGGFGGRYGDIYQAPIIPIVDFNSDGIVNAADVCTMVEHWHPDYPWCDIGPMLWGDGIVDAQDMIVLAEHMANSPGTVNAVNEVQ